MSRVAYVNGRYLPQRNACVNVEDRGYQFADGIYEVLYLCRGQYVDLDRHLGRLERSLREIRIKPPMGRKALLGVLQEVARRNRLQDGLLYMQVTRGVAPRDHAFPAGAPAPSLVVTIRRTRSFPETLDGWGGTAITWPDERWARCDIKSTGLLPNVLARQAAREQGAAEAILIRDGMVTEGAATSIWIVDRQGVACTRHLSHDILPGCTRDALLAVMADAGVAVEQRGFSEAELHAASEVFLTSATSFVKPLLAVDGRPVGDGTPGPVTLRLFDLFARHVRSAPSPSGKGPG